MHYLLLLLTVIFWSGNFIVGRGIHFQIPPVSLAFWRWTIALIVILPFSLRQLITYRKVIQENWHRLALLGLLSVCNFPVFLYMALSSSEVANTALINSMTPIFIVILAFFGLKERITLRQAVGVMISVSGLLFIITSGNPSKLLAVQFQSGDLWTLSAAFSWALYSILLKKFPMKLNPLCFLSAIIVAGLTFISPLYVWEINTGKAFVFSKPALASILYIAIFPSILSYIFWNMAVLKIGANKTGIFIHLIPVFSIIMAILFLSETLRYYHVSGGALIFLGIFLTTKKQ